ncbi:hypothetical protein [Mucilaginibacter myungsuensis]|uniref:Peptidylprolyl isomerase n=1 Tax=Mucilaginibacter myungsuensis TaxID=649104 RepID=A0A929PZ55_9SPHI|nr:hypothetical protein [Mucilaginibacter myungsuensis]MBE9664160.1 hypothetical protein [Mucilaginibacter myungsuensis]MDN3599863.1 hypothetical protein [Mucilaginibacter myungsuensis]
MKRIFFTLLVLGVFAGMSSCRKDADKDIDIRAYDEQQIQAYIKSNGLTGFARDLTGGDTSGIYYKIIKQGTGAVLDYPDMVSLVFTIKSFDGQYLKQDTMINHIYNFLGHVDKVRYANIPYGVQSAIKNILKNKGTTARVLLPSRLAYGRSGFGSGSSESSGRVAGNQSLELYINVINDAETNVIDQSTGKKLTGQDVYDDMVVANYIANNNLTGFQKTNSGLWYKITQPGNGSTITPFMSVNIQWTETLLNGLRTGNEFNNETGTGYPFDLSVDARRGVVEGLQFASPGAKLTLLMPTRLMYKYATSSNLNVPVLSCIRYDINVISFVE